MNDNAYPPLASNPGSADPADLLIDAEHLNPDDAGLASELEHLVRLLSSAQGFDLFRSVDNELFLRGSGAGHCVGLVSAKSGEGRTSISILLAVLAAIHAPRHRVLLVDASLGGNGPSRYFRSTAARTVSRGCSYTGRSVDGSITASNLENLDIATDAGPVGGPAKLSQEGFASFLEEARKQYQLVVVDTPPANLNRDVYSIARLLDAVLLVVRCGYSTREQIQPLVRVLEENQITILGSILNRRIFSIPGFLYGT